MGGRPKVEPVGHETNVVKVLLSVSVLVEIVSCPDPVFEVPSQPTHVTKKITSAAGRQKWP